MTDTRPAGTARNDAVAMCADAIWDAVLRGVTSSTNFAAAVVDALLEHPDLLQRLHDERLMAGGRS